jgi:hypothetical protein
VSGQGRGGAQPISSAGATQPHLNPGKPDEKEDRFEHPSALGSMIPFYGSGKEALADWEDGDYLGAVGNGVLAASDVFLAKAILAGLIKGGLKFGGSQTWRAARARMGKKGFLEKGEHGHHWSIPQDSPVPGWIKHQPPNIKGLDAVTHGRVHGPYTLDGERLRQFNLSEQLLYGTPDWAKAATGSTLGHGMTGTSLAIDDPPSPPRDRR